MTATPSFASDALAGAEARGSAASAASAGPFVLNLCSSTTPMALAQTDLPELRRFTFFVSRRFEEGRERFRLHMGYFATLAEAEEWLGVVREIYPGAWAGESPGRKLRERAVAAAAAQAQHAAGPQPHAIAAAPRPAGIRVPVVHAAPEPHPFQPQAPFAGIEAAASATPNPRQASVKPRPVPDINTAPPPRSTPAVSRTPTASRVAAVSNAPTVSGAPTVSSAAAMRAAVAPAAAHAARPGSKPVFEDSNVREVLKALGDASATGETRLMRSPPPPRELAPPAPGGALSDTQVLKVLEARRADDSQPSPAESDDGGIPLLKPDDTGTREALKAAVAQNAPVAFAVQLQWSVQPVELDKVPPLAIFSAYTLYTVEGSRDARKWYGLRLGFFSDAISAKQVAHYVRSEFASVAVVPVSPVEKSRATQQDVAATLGAPAPARSDPMEEFKLIEEERTARAPAHAPAPAKPGRAPARTAAKPAPAPKVAVGRQLAAQPAAQPRARVRGSAQVGARDQRGAQTLEETLEILGASQLSIDSGTGETLNESGVRHLRVEVQQKNSPFSRLLERLSERMKKS